MIPVVDQHGIADTFYIGKTYLHAFFRRAFGEDDLDGIAIDTRWYWFA